MPTKTKEHTLYSPGKLVKTRKDLYSVDPHERLEEGTVGLILERDHASQLRIQFLNNMVWWVNMTEVEPHLP